MKKIIILAVFILSNVCFINAQETNEKTILSDEYNFLAQFPEKPTYTEGDVDTNFGKGYSRTWKLELSKTTYELSVSDFPDLSVKMDKQSLMTFYKKLGSEFTGKYNADLGTYHSTIFFGEDGRFVGGRSKEFFVSIEMYLIHQRLYQLKVISPISLEDDEKTIDDQRQFLDEFIFVYRSKDEEKYCYGLPETKSQSLKPKKCTKAFTLN